MVEGAFKIAVIQRYNIVEVAEMFLDVNNIDQLFGIIIKTNKHDRGLADVGFLKKVKIIVIGIKNKDLIGGIVFADDIHAGPILGNDGDLLPRTDQVADDRLSKIIPPYHHDMVSETRAIQPKFLVFFQCAHKICNLSNDKTIHAQ